MLHGQPHHILLDVFPFQIHRNQKIVLTVFRNQIQNLFNRRHSFPCKLGIEPTPRIQLLDLRQRKFRNLPFAIGRPVDGVVMNAHQRPIFRSLHIKFKTKTQFQQARKFANVFSGECFSKPRCATINGGSTASDLPATARLTIATNSITKPSCRHIIGAPAFFNVTIFKSAW